MTTYPGASLDDLLVRQTALSIILQGLLDTMIAKALLTSMDVVAIRRYALDLSQDMLDIADTNTRAAGIRIGEEVEAFLRVVVTLPLNPGDNDDIL